MSVKKMQIRYSAPVCVTLAGYDSGSVPIYDEPYLMASDAQRVTVSLHTAKSGRMEPFVKEVCEILSTLVKSDKTQPSFLITSERDLSTRGAQAACIVALTACYLEYVHTEPPANDLIQKVAYTLEKKIFKNHSHAQTTTSLHGGLIFYRKEFDFYKSVVHIPAKFPEEFVQWLSSRSQIPLKNATSDMGLYIRRLIFSIMHENIKLFQEVWGGPSGFVPSVNGLKRE